MELGGVIPPMITPVTSRSGGINRNVARSFSKFLADGGVHGLFPCGSTGEFTSLTRAERSTMIETVSEAVSDIPVLAGCGGNSVHEVVRYIEDADAAGADAGVVVTPFYLQTSQDGLVEFLETIAERSPLEIILYNIPPLTKHRLSPTSVSTLAENPNIIGIKDSSGDMSYHFDLVDQTPDSFCVMQGRSELAVASLDIGSDGLVLGTANAFPELHVELFEAYVRGNHERAVKLIKTVTTPIVSATADIPTAAGQKHLVERAGFDVGDPLLPLPNLSDTEMHDLDECFQRVNETLQKQKLD